MCLLACTHKNLKCKSSSIIYIKKHNWQLSERNINHFAMHHSLTNVREEKRGEEKGEEQRSGEKRREQEVKERK